MIPLPIRTGCFYGTSKKLIAERLRKSKEAHDLLACGMQLPVTQDVISDLEQFVMRYVYGDTKSNISGRREGCELQSSEEEKHSPTCAADSEYLHQHLAHANYIAYLLKHYELQSHPSRSAMDGIL